MANEKKHGFGQNHPSEKNASQHQGQNADKSMKHESKNEKYGKNHDAKCKCCGCDKNSCDNK